MAFSKFQRLVLALSSFLFSTWFITASLEARGSFDALPDDLDAVDIYLHTVDVGNLIFNNFGHTALRVHDKAGGRDLVFNWGIFDFRDPLSFSLRFYQGILVYNLGIYPYASTLRYYLEEERTVWEDKLNLNRQEKEILLKRLIWNARPENRPYNYQYFYDNCSTRPRDYIDEALSGTLRAQTSKTLTPETFREMMYHGYSYNPGMDVLLDVGMNGRLDHQLPVWEKMFHPIALREALLAAKSASGPLIAESKILAQYQGPTSYRDLAYLSILLGFGVPLGLFGIAFFFIVPARAWLLRLFGLISLPLLGFGALVGFLMPVSWALSAHLDLHHNANQLIFWFFDGIYVLIAFVLLVKGRPLALKPRAWQIFRVYTIAHIIVSLTLPVMRALGLIVQNVDRPLVYLLPPYLIAVFLMLRIGVQEEKEARWTPKDQETKGKVKVKAEKLTPAS